MPHYYINAKYLHEPTPTETVDDCASRKEALELLHEYRLAFGTDWKIWLTTEPYTSPSEWTHVPYGWDNTDLPHQRDQ